MQQKTFGKWITLPLFWKFKTVYYIFHSGVFVTLADLFSSFTTVRNCFSPLRKTNPAFDSYYRTIEQEADRSYSLFEVGYPRVNADIIISGCPPNPGRYRIHNTSFSVYPETSCQGLFNQIHKRPQKKCQKHFHAPDTQAGGSLAAT